MNDLRLPCTFSLTAVALAALALATACATERDLPSDAPFDHSRYNPNPGPSSSDARSAADLVPKATATPAPAAGKRLFNFDSSCIDPQSGRTYASGDPEFTACMQKKQTRTP